MKKLLCFLKGHNWSIWTHWITGNRDFRFCHRCGRQEFRR